MKKYVVLVLNCLKTKPEVKALGFNKAELEGIAADIADNLELKEEASDEEVQAEVEKSVNAAIPYLAIAQKTANRVIESRKPKVDEPIEEEKTPKEETPKKEPGNKKEKKTEDEMPKWAEALIETNKLMQQQLQTMQAERVTNSRRESLSALVKDTGTFGKRILKNFDRMQFDTEEDFEEFKSEVESDLAALNQERANEGLSKLGPSAAGSASTKKTDKIEPLSENELQDLADSI